MATITSIAQRILDEHGYTTEDIPLANLEYLIDDAIDYVNLQAGLSIAHLASSEEGDKNLTAADGEILIVKWLANLAIRAYKEKGTQVGLGSISISVVVNDSDSKVSAMILKAIDRLKKPPIYVSNDPVP